jgi:hypothetical protein
MAMLLSVKRPGAETAYGARHAELDKREIISLIQNLPVFNDE